MKTLRTELENYKYQQFPAEQRRLGEIEPTGGPMKAKTTYRTQAELLPLLEKAERLVKDSGMSQTAAAKEVGIGQGQLSRHLIGKGVVTRPSLLGKRYKTYRRSKGTAERTATGRLTQHEIGRRCREAYLLLKSGKARTYKEAADMAGANRVTFGRFMKDKPKPRAMKSRHLIGKQRGQRKARLNREPKASPLDLISTKSLAHEIVNELIRRLK